MDTSSGYMFRLVLDISLLIDTDSGYMFRIVLAIV